MTDRFAYLYQKQFEENDLVEVINDFNSQGIFLANPDTQLISSLSKDGEQLVVSREWLISQVNARETINFQWWLNGSIDLYCRVRFLTDLIIKEFGLDGLGEKITFINKVLITWFRKEIPLGIARGIVIDNFGVSEEYNWDDFFIEGKNFEGEIPDVLGMKSSDLPRIKTITEDIQTETIGDFVILSKLQNNTLMGLTGVSIEEE